VRAGQNEKMIESLPHNPRNAVTARIEKQTDQVADGTRTFVRKVLNANNHDHTPTEWAASSDPQHWNYWRREALIYRSDLSQWLTGCQVRLPQMFECQQTGDDEIELTLEWIEGRHGKTLTIDDYAHIAYAWAGAQMRIAERPWQAPWASRQFIEAYAASKPVDYALLQDDRAWQAPLIKDNWPSQLRQKLLNLYRHREALLTILNRGPKLPSHLDLWPNNVFVTPDDMVVPIDWSFFGFGTLAEDIGNFIPDSVFDDFMSPDQLPELEKKMFTGYLDGLADAGASFDTALVRRLLHASAVKYVWLGPLLLERAGQKTQSAYGGVALDDANEQYRARGATLDFLCGWAEQALD